MRKKGYEFLAFCMIASLTIVGCGGGGGSSNGSNNLGNPGGSNSGGSTSGGTTGGNTGGGSAGSTTSGGGGSATTSATVAQVILGPANPAVTAGNTVVITALAQDSAGNPISVPSGNWTWTSSSGSVALLTSIGDHAVVTGVGAGTATITATEGHSKVSGSVTLTVNAASSGSGSGSGSGGSTGTVVYTNNFQFGAGSEWSNTNTDVTPGTAKYPSTRFLGQFGKQTVSLTLNNLPAHSNLTVEFDLFIIQSMDGNATVQGVGPDVWDLSVQGGPTLLHTTFSNITSSLAIGGSFPQGYFQAYPGTFPGSNNPYQTGASQVNTLGYLWNGQPDDAVYHLKYTIPHTASTVQYNFMSGQTEPVGNESWGLKNVTVTVNP